MTFDCCYPKLAKGYFSTDSSFGLLEHHIAGRGGNGNHVEGVILKRLVGALPSMNYGLV